MSRHAKDEIELLEQDIARLRGIGTAEANRYANDLEIRLVLVRQKIARMENLTIERLQEWFKQIGDELDERGLDKSAPDSWPERLRNEAYEGLQVAWSAARFRARGAAEMMGINLTLVSQWLTMASWKTWLGERQRREDQVKTIIDMATQRAASILAIDTDDPEVLKVQQQCIKTVFSTGFTVTEALPGSGRKNSARQGLPAPSGEKVVTEKKRTLAKK